MRALLLCLALVGSAVAADAASIAVSPSASSLSIGDALDVAIVVDAGGLGVGGFDLDLLYDAAVLQLDAVTFGSGLDLGGFGSSRFSDGSLAGTLSAFEVSFEDPSDLLAAQPPSFALLTLRFVAVGAGTSALSAAAGPSGTALSDAFGGVLATTFSGSSVSVPEPALAWLLAAAALLGFRRAR